MPYSCFVLFSFVHTLMSLKHKFIFKNIFIPYSLSLLIVNHNYFSRSLHEINFRVNNKCINNECSCEEHK